MEDESPSCEVRCAGGGSQPMGEQATSNESEHGGFSEQMGSIQGGGEGGMATAAATSSPDANESYTAMEGGEEAAQGVMETGGSQGMDKGSGEGGNVQETSFQEFKENRM